MSRFVLATDLDGTFAHGSGEARDRLLTWLAERADATLIYVTGRTPDAARRLAEETPLPRPDLLIADVGTSVLRGLGPERVEPIEAELEREWPGEAAVRERLEGPEGLDTLAPQEIHAPRRVSYWIEPVRRRTTAPAPDDDPFAARDPGDATLDEEAEAVADGVAREVRRRLEGMDVDVVVSANVFLDVLPRGVNKGTTLLRVLHWLGAERDACVVAGDSLNDLALFETGLRGIAVGNCEPALRQRVAGMERVYQAAGPGVEGLLEGLRHHGRQGDRSDRRDEHGQ